MTLTELRNILLISLLAYVFMFGVKIFAESMNEHTLIEDEIQAEKREKYWASEMSQ